MSPLNVFRYLLCLSESWLLLRWSLSGRLSHVVVAALCGVILGSTVTSVMVGVGGNGTLLRLVDFRPVCGVPSLSVQGGAVGTVSRGWVSGWCCVTHCCSCRGRYNDSSGWGFRPASSFVWGFRPGACCPPSSRLRCSVSGQLRRGRLALSMSSLMPGSSLV